jgi:hypothetical protein
MAAAMTDELDPFRPHTPEAHELGRLFLAGRLEAGWPCRWCGALLAKTAWTTAGSLVLCLTCDPID